jgi:hypothetical protein
MCDKAPALDDYAPDYDTRGEEGRELADAELLDGPPDGFRPRKSALVMVRETLYTGLVSEAHGLLTDPVDRSFGDPEYLRGLTELAMRAARLDFETYYKQVRRDIIKGTPTVTFLP